MWKVNVNLDDLELRSCDNHLLTNDGEHTTMDIIKWDKMHDGKKHCYSLAYFKVKPEDLIADLIFVDGRPFDNKIDKDKFWQLARLGYKILKSKMEREYNE